MITSRSTHGPHAIYKSTPAATGIADRRVQRQMLCSSAVSQNLSGFRAMDRVHRVDDRREPNLYQRLLQMVTSADLDITRSNACYHFEGRDLTFRFYTTLLKIKFKGSRFKQCSFMRRFTQRLPIPDIATSGQRRFREIGSRGGSNIDFIKVEVYALSAQAKLLLKTISLIKRG